MFRSGLGRKFHIRHTFTTVRAMRLAANTSNGQVNKYLVVQKLLHGLFEWRLSVSQNESMQIAIFGFGKRHTKTYIHRWRLSIQRWSAYTSSSVICCCFYLFDLANLKMLALFRLLLLMLVDVCRRCIHSANREMRGKKPCDVCIGLALVSRIAVALPLLLQQDDRIIYSHFTQLSSIAPYDMDGCSLVGLSMFILLLAILSYARGSTRQRFNEGKCVCAKRDNTKIRLPKERQRIGDM